MPRDILLDKLLKVSSLRMSNKVVSAKELKDAMQPLISAIPKLAKVLPSSGTVIIGQRFSNMPMEAARVLAMQMVGKIDAGLLTADLNAVLGDSWVDPYGKVHHGHEGTTPVPQPETTTTPSPDPAVEARKKKGGDFAHQLLSYSWNAVVMPYTNFKIESIFLPNNTTNQLKTVFDNKDMTDGFKQGLILNPTNPLYDNSCRWRNIVLSLGTDKIKTVADAALNFGPFTGLTALLLNGVASVNHQTDSDKVLGTLAQGLTGPQPSDGEKAAAAEDVVNALVGANWHYEVFITTAEMSHDQAQRFGKGCKFLTPWLIKTGEQMKQSSSSDSDSGTASTIIGTILVLLGTILGFLGDAILGADHGNGITLFTNFGLGFILFAVPILWVESR